MMLKNDNIVFHLRLIFMLTTAVLLFTAVSALLFEALLIFYQLYFENYALAWFSIFFAVSVFPLSVFPHVVFGALRDLFSFDRKTNKRG